MKKKIDWLNYFNNNLKWITIHWYLFSWIYITLWISFYWMIYDLLCIVLLLGRIILFFEELLFCSLKNCHVLWTSTVFFELLFFIWTNVTFFEELSSLKWRTVFFEESLSLKNYFSLNYYFVLITTLFLQELCSLNYFSLNYCCSLNYYCVLWIIVLFFELFFSSLNCPSCITQSLTLAVGTMEFNITQRVLKDQYGRR